MKTIDINVILTFCSYKEYGSQEIFDINLSYEKKYTSAKKLLDQSAFFDTITQICEECGRLPTELVKISTAADWTKRGFDFDIGNGKWSFGSWRGQNVEWSDNLARLHGFGRDDDTAGCDLNLHALRGIMSAKAAAAAISKAGGK
jgi:hypothetical protein